MKSAAFIVLCILSFSIYILPLNDVYAKNDGRLQTPDSAIEESADQTAPAGKQVAFVNNTALPASVFFTTTLRVFGGANSTKTSIPPGGKVLFNLPASTYVQLGTNLDDKWSTLPKKKVPPLPPQWGNFPNILDKSWDYGYLITTSLESFELTVEESTYWRNAVLKSTTPQSFQIDSSFTHIDIEKRV